VDDDSTPDAKERDHGRWILEVAQYQCERFSALPMRAFQRTGFRSILHAVSVAGALGRCRARKTTGSGKNLAIYTPKMRSNETNSCCSFKTNLLGSLSL
jgi:hypothetical protein